MDMSVNTAAEVHAGILKAEVSGNYRHTHTDRGN